jgi:hypothetical protein
MLYIDFSLIFYLIIRMDKHARQVIDAGLLDKVSQIFAEADFDLRKEVIITLYLYVITIILIIINRLHT